MKYGVILAGLILGIAFLPPLEAAKKQKERSASDVEQEEGKLRAEERKLLEQQLELHDRKKALLEEKLKLLDAPDQAPTKRSPEAPKMADPVFESPAPLPVKEEKKSVPPPPPVFEPAVVPPSSGSKRASDLPEGWEEEAVVPEGAVRIEDLGKKKPSSYVPLERLRQEPAAPASPSEGDAIGRPVFGAPPQQKKKVEKTPVAEEKKPVKKQPKRWE